jgi:hypothetical protein
MDYLDRAVDREHARLLERMRDLQAMRENTAREYRGYSLRNAILRLAHDEPRNFFEAEVSADLERTHPAKHGGIVVPFEILTRANLVANAAGALVETLNVAAADALRPSMVCGALGATFIPAPMGANVNLPRLTATGTASWLSTEQTAESESQSTIGQVAFAPKTVASYSEYSRLLMLEAGPSSAEFVVRRDLVNVVARALDLAALFGSGLGGVPKGLATTTGVSTFSGTSLNLAGLVNAATALGDALDDSAGVACNRTTAGTLAQREILGGSERVWMGSLVAGTVVGYSARSSSQIPAGALILGSWRYLNIVVWGEGVEIVVNPFGDSTNQNFKTGIIGVRAFLTADAAPTFPSAFNYASTVT